jgi:hypothetical protein
MTDAKSLNIPLMDLQRRHCREVTGTGDDGLALFCGQPKSGRTSYCLHHRRINLMMVVVQPARKPSAQVRDSRLAMKAAGE